MESNIKQFLLFFIAALPLSLAAQPNSGDTAGSIPREIVTHKIVSEELRTLIADYDRMYAQFTDDPSKGLLVFCTVYSDSIAYTVLHMYDIAPKGGLIICEPINGKEVTITIWDLRKQIELPTRRSVELLKNSSLSMYQYHKQFQKRVDNSPEGIVGGEYRVSGTYDFVEWEIVFDKRTGECLRKYTPDWTKRYQKSQKRYQKAQEKLKRSEID